MIFRSRVAATFEVSRRIAFHAPKKGKTPIFTGAVALDSLREQWSKYREGYQNPVQHMQHPGLGTGKVVLLHSSEVRAAIMTETNKEGKPAPNKLHARQFRKELGRIMSSKSVETLKDVQAPLFVRHAVGINEFQHLFMPMLPEDVGEQAVILERERALYLNTLRDITEVTTVEPFGPAIMIGQLPAEFPPEDTNIFCLEMINSVLAADERSRRKSLDEAPLATLALMKPAIIE